MTAFDMDVFKQPLIFSILHVVHSEQADFAEDASFGNASNLNLLGISCLVMSYKAHGDQSFLRLRTFSGLRVSQIFPRQRPILPPLDTPSPNHRSQRSDRAHLLVRKRPSPWPLDLASS